MLLAVGAVLSFSLGLDNGLARTPPMGYIENKECMNSNGRLSIDTAIFPVGSRSVASQPRFHRKHIYLVNRWCSWNAYHRRFNETVFLNVAAQMKKNGMQKAVWYRERGLANALSTSFCEFLNLKSASFFSSNFIDLSIYDHGSSPQGYHYINVDGGWWAGSDTGHIQRNASGYFMENKVCCFAIVARANILLLQSLIHIYLPGKISGWFGKFDSPTPRRRFQVGPLYRFW